MHFVGIDERLLKQRESRGRLVPGALFVMAHLSLSREAGDKERWLSRYFACAVSSGVGPGNARNAAVAIGSKLSIISPADEEALLAEAGFTSVRLFYAGLAFRGGRA